MLQRRFCYLVARGNGKARESDIVLPSNCVCAVTLAPMFKPSSGGVPPDQRRDHKCCGWRCLPALAGLLEVQIRHFDRRRHRRARGGGVSKFHYGGPFGPGNECEAHQVPAVNVKDLPHALLAGSSQREDKCILTAPGVMESRTSTLLAPGGKTLNLSRFLDPRCRRSNTDFASENVQCRPECCLRTLVAPVGCPSTGSCASRPEILCVRSSNSRDHAVALKGLKHEAVSNVLSTLLDGTTEQGNFSLRNGWHGRRRYCCRTVGRRGDSRTASPEVPRVPFLRLLALPGVSLPGTRKAVVGEHRIGAREANCQDERT